MWYSWHDNGLAFSVGLETNGNFTTVELKISSLKPVWTEKTTTKGEVIKKTKTIRLIKSEVFNEINPLVAHTHKVPIGYSEINRDWFYH